MKYMLLIVVLLTPFTGRSKDNIELRLAKLWGIVDELEIRLKKQEEKIRILEKGLMLGVVPDELLKEKSKLNLDDLNVDASHKSTAVMKKNRGRSPKPSVAQGSPEDYEKLVKKAQKMFRSQNYGQAIDLYQKIERHHVAQNNEGQSAYWVGLSWFYLKEFDLSDDNFSRLINNYSKSPWIPRAMFYRAKILSEKGLYEKAIAGFRKLLKKYPNSEISEMAALEIKMIRERI